VGKDTCQIKKRGGKEGRKETLQVIKHQMDEEVEIKKKIRPDSLGDRWQAKLLTALCLIFMLLSNSVMMK